MLEAERLTGEAHDKFANVLAFLWMIRVCEGTDAPNGYRYLFGSTKGHELLFDDMSKHPNVKTAFRALDGTTMYTTAAGAYQEIFPTWERHRIKLSLPDFSPESQDRSAISIIKDRGQLENVEAGNVREAIDVLWIEWASLPASQYNQPKRNLEFAVAAYESGGGRVA